MVFARLLENLERDHAYRGIVPTIATSATLGPVRIGNDVQILENTVLNLLPDNDLIIGDGVIIGPGAMIDGFPAIEVGCISGPPPTPAWALRPDDLPAIW